MLTEEEDKTTVNPLKEYIGVEIILTSDLPIVRVYCMALAICT
jgi:hypothetical protein